MTYRGCTIYYFIGLVTFVYMQTIDDSNSDREIVTISHNGYGTADCMYWQSMGMPNFCRQQTTTEVINTGSYERTATISSPPSSPVIDTVDEMLLLPGRLDWCEYWRKIEKLECRLPQNIPINPQ
jgi:hypothetical protein